MTRKLELVTRHPSHNSIAERDAIVEGPTSLLHYFMLTFADPFASSELLDSSYIDTVHTSSVVCQKCGQRSPNNLTPIDNAYDTTEKSVAVRKDRVVNVEILKNLDNCQRRAG